jgi:adenylate cyclase
LSFIAELKRRNVFRVAIAFAITAWLIAQIAGLAADSFGAPDWVMKMIITVLMLGFPIAMVLAWAYEMTPEGLRRDSGEDEGRSASTSKLDRTITIALVAALGYFAYDKFVLDPQRDAALMEAVSQQTAEIIPDPVQTEQSPETADQSIAVLPFVNMSDDSSNEYFSEGLSEELLNLLVRIPELKVAARTSSFSYKGKDVKISQVGQELNVAHVLEGSVRKSGNQVRITAQLIKADDGFHLWSQTYDRTLDNIFQIQDEIAAAVVEELKITLLGAIPEARETDPEVYSLYLRGKYLNTETADQEELEEAVKAFKQALEIDPEYAPAWLGLSWAYEYQGGGSALKYDQRATLARETADRALAIDDSLALAWSTMSFLKKKYDWDWEGAKAAADRALQLEPNNVDVLLGTASVAFGLGQLDKSIELLERASALDPLRPGVLGNLGYRYMLDGRFEEAIEKYQQVLVLFPENDYAALGIAEIYLRWGNPERALAEVDKLPWSGRQNNLKAEILFTLGQEKESRALTIEFLNTPVQESPYPKAVIYTSRGEYDSAFEALEAAFDQHNSSLSNFLFVNGFNRLEADPRYPVFLEKLGLLEYWKELPAD